MTSLFRGSLPVAALCFAMAATTHGNDRGEGHGAQRLQYPATTASTEQPSPISRATLIPLNDEPEPAGSVVAAAMWGATDNTGNTLQLPQLQSAPGTDEGGISRKIGTKLRQELQSRGQKFLTPKGLADAMKQGEGIDIDIQESATAMGTQLSQGVIDAGLRRVESSLQGHNFFRAINLSWSPGFNQREDMYQVDSMLSLHEGHAASVMSQLGIQSRDGEPAVNAGMILRTRAFRDWVFGLNTFYDYLSDPQVDRWSAGVEIYGRWFTVTSNIYNGMDEDVVLGQRWYSPDGWDIEFAGRAPQFPWLEYSGRYYHWDRDGESDLKGQDYKLTLKPMQLLDLSLRYDAARGGSGKLGFEAQLKYRFDISVNEQNSISRCRGTIRPMAAQV